MKKFFAIAPFVLLVAAAWLTFSQHPIAANISRWQTRFTEDNSYYPALTIFILVLPPLLILLVLKLWWQKKYR